MLRRLSILSGGLLLTIIWLLSLGLVYFMAATPSVEKPLVEEYGAYTGNCPEAGQRSDIELQFVEKLLDQEPFPPALLALAKSPHIIARIKKAEKTQREWDWPNLCKYRADNLRLKESGEANNIVFLGDSITEIWGMAQPALFTKGNVNRGISGQTSPQMLTRFYADVIDLSPRVVHIFAGVNDVAANTGMSDFSSISGNIKSMVELAKAHGIEVWLASLPPIVTYSWSPDVDAQAAIQEINSWLKAYAEEQHIRYIDYYSSLRGEVEGFKAGYSKDGVHPTRLGYQAMFSALEPLLGDDG